MVERRLQSRRRSSRSQQPLRRCRQDWRSRPREAEGVAAVRAAKAVAAAKVEEKEGEGEGDSSKLRLSRSISQGLGVYSFHVLFTLRLPTTHK